MTAFRDFPEITHRVDGAAIDAYAELSGDFNPLHVDPDYAAAGPFGTVVAHGPVGLQTVFAAAVRWLGGDRLATGTRIDVAYRGPVRIGDEVTCRADEVLDHAGSLAVRVTAVNQHGDDVLQALVIVPRDAVPRA